MMNPKSKIQNLKCGLLAILSLSFFACAAAARGANAPPDFNAKVLPVFTKYCTGCHNADDRDGKLVLESYADLLKGGKRGAEVVAGHAEQSRLVRVLAGETDLVMPPKDNEKPKADEIALLRIWINAGAKGPSGSAPDPNNLVIPKIAPTAPVRRPIAAVACSPDGRWIAVARYGVVELLAADSRKVVRTLADHPGNVNDVCFSADSSKLAAAAGQAGLFGEARLWNVADGRLLQKFRGHRDSLYAVSLSPDGKTLATAGYDQKIKLWNADSGAELRTLAGHNGAVYALAFRPGGKLLASASGDRTCKLWNVASGERLETFGQPLLEQYTVAFSPDGQQLAGAGADNRIRIWQISETGKEGTNPLLISRFGSEHPLLKLVCSPDGRMLASASEDGTIKLWDSATLVELRTLEPQPDTAAAMAFLPQGNRLVVGRMDGSLAIYDAASGERVASVTIEPSRAASATIEPSRYGGHAPASTQPEGLPESSPGLPRFAATLGRRGSINLSRPERPRVGAILPTSESRTGSTRGPSGRVASLGPHAQGSSLARATLGWAPAALQAAFPGAHGVRAGLDVLVAIANASTRDFVESPAEQVKAQQTIPEQDEVEPNNTPAQANYLPKLPVTIKGTLGAPGDVDYFSFDAAAGETLVFDVTAQTAGSKAAPHLALFDAHGKLLDDRSQFDAASDPLLAYTFKDAGRYLVRIDDRMMAGGPKNSYRLTIGAVPYVIGCFPLGVPAHAATDVQLIGFNLPPDTKVKVSAAAPGEATVPIDTHQFRLRGELKILVSDLPETVAAEPNDAPARALAIPAPGSVCGRIRARPAGQPADAGYYRFESKAGRTWVIETTAARRGSPIDTRIDVLWPDGRPVERLVLESVRDSFINFRPLNSIDDAPRLKNWEEMDVHQYIYMGGEVCKLFRWPQGPDAEWSLYRDSLGRRRTFFDTTATTHANYDPVYVVQPHPPGTKLPNSGLPIFPIYYTNDDASDRSFGRDSQLLFTAPADGSYLVRVTDTRGQGGDRYVYRLTVREPKADFRVRIADNDDKPIPRLNVPAGGGVSFELHVDRLDYFEGPIRVDISGLPRGFSATTPLIIQPGMPRAEGAIHALESASPPAADAPAAKIVATARIDGREVSHSLADVGQLKLTAPPKLLIHAGEGWSYSISLGEHWVPLDPSSAISKAGATLKKLDDGSLLAGGVNADKDSYTVVCLTDVRSIRAIRLEALGDASLPAGAPGRADGNGNFILSEFRVTAAPRSDFARAVALPVASASADYSQPGWAAAAATDGNPATGWSVGADDPEHGWPVARRSGSPDHAITFQLKDPAGFAGGTILTFTLDQTGEIRRHNLGRFRLSVLTDESQPDVPPPAEIVIAPGTTTKCRLLVDRRGFNDEVQLYVANLPHGVIVANLGLSRVFIPKDRSEVTVTLKAAPWVPESDRLIYAKTEDDKFVSPPALLRVRRPPGVAKSK